MSHQDDVHLRKNIRAFKAILEAAVPESVASFVRHGNAKLDPAWLASVAMTCWGWMSEGTLTHRVSAACTVVGHVFERKETVSRQGLMKALSTCGPELVDRMILSLTDHVKGLKGYWTHKGKVNIAVDGSKFGAPRTAANQDYFAATGNQKKKKKKKSYKKVSDQSKASTVQVLLTVFWHMQSGLPLQWMTSASNGSERRNAAKMLDHLSRNARLIGDAEYVGYPLWSKIHNSGRSFLVRVGSNLKFLTQLGKYRLEDGFVYYWPEGVMLANEPPLVLRLIQIHDGKKAIFLVTNELDMDDELACELYSWRWKIEMFFRTVKQTCERAKLHCERPENVLTELNWTLLGIWHALFSGKQVLLNEGLSPLDVSPVKVMKAVTKVVQLIYTVATPVSLLQEELAKAVVDDESARTTSKRSRHFPRKKKHRRCGAPKLCSPTPTQLKRAQILRV
jgi:hypothetical protein